MWRLTSAAFLGWSLGANDASNVFGTAVSSRMIRFWTAAFLCAAFVLAGAAFFGHAGMDTYQKLSTYSADWAFVVSLSAACTVTLMTFLSLPVSTSQAVVGSMLAAGVAGGNVHMESLFKVVVCWIATPFGAMLAAMVLYRLLGILFNQWNPTLFVYDQILRWGLILAGCYGAFALGANNVANVTGPFVASGLIGTGAATVFGGIAIALGVLTYSRAVMMTVGKGIVQLNAFSAFVVVLSQALTVHVFAWIGVPVSTSQAVVGAVLGIGILRDVRTINTRTLRNVLFGWLLTPTVGFFLTLVWLMVQKHL